MRQTALLIATISLGLSSCVGSTRTPLLADSPMPIAAAEQRVSDSLALLGESLLTVDLSTLTATTELLPARSTSANDDLYVLDIAKFIRPETFTVRHVELDGDELAITWRVTHPFAAPSDPEGAPSATNRADLGFTGMVLFRVTVPFAQTHTYFTDVICNTTLIRNADAYYRPDGLISGHASFANTFPYQAIVDETGPHGTRVGVSNNSTVSGNFGTNGWTRTKLGESRTDWTGFGVLHQGQVSERTVRVSLAAMDPSDRFSMHVALLAKYNDPRGGVSPVEKIANRLPYKPSDPLKIGYRMPHGALDCSRIETFPDLGGYEANTVSACTLRFHVTDWDARAPDTTKSDLATDPDVTRVALGEGRPPTLAVCIPGVLGDPTVIATLDPSSLIDNDAAVGGDAGMDSGQTEDPLYFASSVPKVAGVGQAPGIYQGLVRATDPESAAFITELDGESLLPLTSDQPANATYQAFEVSLIAAGAGWTKSYNSPRSEITGIATDPDGNHYLCGWIEAWIDFGTGQENPPGSTSGFILKLGPDGSLLWRRFIGGPFSGNALIHGLALTPSGEVIVTGEFDQECEFEPGFTLDSGGFDPAPFVAKYTAESGFMWVRQPTTLGIGRDIATNAQGNILATGYSGAAIRDGWIMRWASDGTKDGEVLWNATGNNSGESIATDATGNIYVGGHGWSLNLGTGTLCTGGLQDVVLAKYTQAGQIAWATWWGAGGEDSIAEIDVDRRDGSVVAASTIVGTVHFGEVTVNNQGSEDGLVVKFSNSGDYRWHHAIGEFGSEFLKCVDVGPGGRVVVGGMYTHPVDFGGGVRPSGQDPPNYDSVVSAFHVNLTPDGQWLWDSQNRGGNNAYIWTTAVEYGADGWILVGGFHNSSMDLDPGPDFRWSTAQANRNPVYVLRLRGSTGLL